MTTATVFYSWQSDAPARTNRLFIERALTLAIKRLETDAALESVVRDAPLKLDKDTEGIPGSPPIADTILLKIEKCAAFVADLTLVGESLAVLQGMDGFRKRLFPNPNVLLEYGYALRCHGHERLIAVLNTAYGESHTENLPFDLRHLRWPIKYHLPDGADAEQKNAALEALVSSLSGALKLMIEAQPMRSSETHANDFAPQRSLESDPAVFVEDVTELIPEKPSHWKLELNQLANEGRAYLRVYPLKAQSLLKTALDARTLASTGGLRPMGTELSGWTPARNVFGAIVYESPVEGTLYHLTQLFLNQEH